MTNSENKPDAGTGQTQRPGPFKRFLSESLKYIVFTGLGGLLAVLSSYLMRQFGY
ncbi:MAG: hypothetical protein H6964_08275 [Chromatiaceae bacterium]|nr:hypothetical protein [Gammaproteobacteria bacterium]MCB1870668.1 hypothetical protein [Gammaproteobacteria bacterium]MCB1880455.1 hypothetical protein [Gammaproteobacteria bacterium]MCP5446976.1 hypothetical protein [Chromatiaceae bacterium]